MPAEFVVEEVPSAAALADALGAEASPAYDERRTWFDTFDGRLYDAGLLLELHEHRRGTTLTLSTLDGKPLARVPYDAGTVTAESLPEGEIRDRVSKPVGIRALLPGATVEGPVTELAVLDDLDKTVARIEVEGPLTAGDGELPGRLRVEALRGYAKAARTTAADLAALDGVEKATEPQFRQVYAACGEDPAGFKSKLEPLDDRDQPAGAAYGVLLTRLLVILRANLDGTLRQLDTEFLHDLRVSVRRARSLVKFAADALPDDRRGTLGTELKWLGDATSASRDLDVYLLGFDDLAAYVPEPETLEPFRKLLVRHRRQSHTGLNRSLRSARFRRLTELWATTTEGGTTPVGPLADTLIHKVWRRVEKRGDAITDVSPAEAVHDLRKRCKELRYLLEFFAGLYDAGQHAGIISELKNLQDNLGEFQDCESQRLLVLHYAEELYESGVPVTTMLSMGRLEGRLEQRQAAARDEFADRWARFARPRNRRRIEELVHT